MGIAAQLGCEFEALGPGLFADFSAGARVGFVQGRDGIKVDLLVEIVLECRGYVV